MLSLVKWELISDLANLILNLIYPIRFSLHEAVVVYRISFEEFVV